LWDIQKGYELAKEIYQEIGIDIDRAIEICDQMPLSIHCWQGDDCTGFESKSGGLTGGIQATGNYPYKARNFEELASDLAQAFSYVPGEKKVNLHAFYLDDKKADRNEIEPQHFDRWIEWANKQSIGMDFNGTFFSHPLSKDSTLSSSDETVRRFWIEHAVRVRKIAAYMAEKTGKTTVNNIWIPDGSKEVPVDTLSPRKRLAESLDEILAVKYDSVVDCVESKLFGIGSEAYVVGSHEFYMGYVLSRNNALLTLDTGHFHPTEAVSSKISPLLLFVPGLLLHLSRPIRWDSDHVVSFDEETRNIMGELVRLNVLDRVHMALDYFDASINRVMALAIGARNARKALLEALLTPVGRLIELEAKGDRSTSLALTEEWKAMPFSLVWDYYCARKGVPVGTGWIEDAKEYEQQTMRKREQNERIL